MDFHDQMTTETRALVQELAKLAQESQTECFLVGGFLRDLLLGKDPKDIDIVVMDEVKMEPFIDRLQKGGFRHPVRFSTFGTYRTAKNGFEVEIVPPRGKTLEEDLQLRDFTINTLVVPLKLPLPKEISDPLDVACNDLKAKRIRAFSDPEKIIAEDPLRMLRAVRLATTLEFRIDEDLKRAIHKQRELGRDVAAERVQEELSKIFLAAKPARGLRLMDELGLLEVFLPEIAIMVGKEQRSPYHHQDVFEHSLTVLEKTPPDLSIRIAALLHDQGKVDAERKKGDRWVYWGHEHISTKNARALLERLCFPNRVRDEATFLIEHHMVPYKEEEWGDSAVRRFAHRAGPYLHKLIALLKADSGALRPPHAHPEKYDRLLERIEALQSEKIYRLQPPLNGYEIMELFGWKPGPIVGEAKQALIDAILDGKLDKDNKEGAKKYLQIKFGTRS